MQNALLIGVWSIVIAWATPTTNEDGSPLNDLAGFMVYQGATSNTTTELMDVVTNDVNSTPSYGDSYQYQFTPISNDMWYAVTAYDLDGQESELSPPIHWLDVAPSAPTAQITITIQQ